MSLRYIQELLGHSSSETTEVYTHITKKARNQFASPLDFLDIEIVELPKNDNSANDKYKNT